MMSKSHYRICFVLLLSLIVHQVTGQSISGSTTPTAGVNTNYSISDDQIFSNPNWVATNGNIVSTSQSGLTYYVTINWQYPGSQTLTFRNGSTVISQLSVSVTCPNVPVPSTTFSYSSNCNNITITRNATPPTGQKWYWQTSSSAQETNLGYGSTLTVSSGGTYYLRTNSGKAVGCWSATSLATASIPSNPSVTNGTQCGPGTVNLSASAGSNDVRWYSSCSGGSVLQTGSNFTTPSISSTTTYYASAYNSSSGAESKRVAVTATIASVPTPPVSASASPSTLCGTGSVTLSATGAVSGQSYVWYTVQTGGTPLPSSTPSVSTTTTFWVAKKDNTTGCESSRISTQVTVNPVPTVFTLGGSGSYCVTSNGRSVTLSGSQVNVNYQLKKNGVNEGSPLSGTNSSLTWTDKTVGAYTIVATNSNGTCATTMSGTTTITQDQISVGGTLASIAEDYYTGNGTLELTGHTGSLVRWERNEGAGWFDTEQPTTTTYTYKRLPDTREFRAVVQNGVCAAATSSVVKVEVVHLPYTGTKVLTTASSSNYQWYKNGNIISGATQQNYTINDAGVYKVQVTSTPYTVGAYYVYPTLSNTIQKINAISSIRILTEGITENTSLYTLNSDELMQTISYQDGLGRTFQTIGVGLSPQQTDMVSAIGFGKQGLIDSTYLSYGSTSADGRYKVNAIRGTNGTYTTSEQYQFFQGTTNVVTDNYPFARSIHRNTPDARVTEQGAPGYDWQPGNNHTVKSKLTFNNNTAYAVRLWKTNGTTTGNYPERSVSVSITTDENGNKVRTFTNMLGQTVLKQVQEGTSHWLETYYVYDEFGRLKYQVPPKAVELLDANPDIENDTNLSELIFKYTYDNLGRLVEKKVPGAAVQYIVYDQHDRIVLTQDGNQRLQNLWMFIKYDRYNRPVYSGLYTSASSRTTLQSSVNGINYDTTPWFETEQGSTAHGYSNNVFPTSNTTVLSVNYFDHYDFNRDGSPDYGYDNAHLDGQDAAANPRTRNLPTGNKRFTLDTAGNVTSTALIGVVFYDHYGRAIQTQSNNPLYTTIADKTTVLYDFSGKVLKTKTSHFQNASTSISLIDRPEYDHAGRVLKLYRKINEGSEKLLVQYEYNALGQLVTKKIHEIGSNQWLQTVDYTYNIRGWLKRINDPGSIGTDFFAQELVYNENLGALGQTASFNGNISAVKWRENFGNGMSEDQKAFAYTYSKNDQLKEARFGVGSAFDQQANRFNEQNITYDANGNILTLERKGVDALGAITTIDSLHYTYDANRLKKVTDSGTSLGFSDSANTTEEYGYDANGSIVADANKGIDTVVYNFLNKVQKIVFTNGKVITYSYDVTGSKLSMNELQGSTLLKSTKYVGGYIYENDTLRFFSSPEGRTVVNNGSYEYQYALADHQGNTRTVFTSNIDSLVYLATFETSGSGLREDTDLFENTGGTNEVNSTAGNVTNGGGRAMRLNKDYKAGPGLMLRVYPGDKIDARVHAYYENGSGFSASATLASMITAIAGAFGGVSGAGGESGTIYNNINDAITAVGLGGNQSDTIPSAWLNYIYFDDIDGFDYENQEDNAGWIRVPTAARNNNALMHLDIPVIKKPGYLYIYLSYENESSNWVYFDDMEVTYVKSPVVQSNSYYAFGMQTADSWTRTDTRPNQYLYNSGSELNGSTGVYETPLRGYDPKLGRFTGVDIMADSYSSLTPYQYANNDPVFYNDPTGAYATGDEWWNAPRATWGRRGDPTHWREQQRLYAQSQAATQRSFGNSSYRGDGQPFFREFGVSMAFGYLPHSEVGREYIDQMRSDANHLDLDGYVNKYGYELWVHGKDHIDPVDGSVAFQPQYFFLKPHSEFSNGPPQQAQGDPNMARLLGVIDQYAFYGEKHDINWIIDYDGKGGTKSYSPGVTEPWLTNGKRNVYIHPSAFDKGNDKLFVILGHEYVHTIDHDNGLFKSLMDQYKYQSIVHNIFEYRAYTWSAAAEQTLGIGLGQAGMLEYYRGLLPKDYLGR